MKIFGSKRLDNKFDVLLQSNNLPNTIVMWQHCDKGVLFKCNTFYGVHITPTSKVALATKEVCT